MTRLFMSIVFVVVASAIIMAVNGEQQCYVCIPTVDYDGDVTKMFPREEIPLCGTTLVAKVCPPSSSRGCLTEINGRQVMRMCAHLAMNDCKTANLVEYCYCTGNLCNSGAVKEVHTKPSDDDEDLAEGSGMGATVMLQTPKSTSTTTTTTSNSVKPTNYATNHSITRTLKFVCLFVLLLMWH